MRLVPRRTAAGHFLLKEWCLVGSIEEIVCTRVLPHVRRPAAYMGGEWNEVRKDHAGVDLKVCLAFPDTYAIGMSHAGFQILYGTVNRRPDALAERVFAPWADMEEQLRAKGLPLYSLESFTPLHEFDILGFSLQYEMSYTNVLNMLDLGGIPLRVAERGAGDTLVIAGGGCALNGEPMADYIDLFLPGDGEETIHDLLDACRTARAENPSTRDELLAAIVRRCANAYAPSLYDASWNDDGTLREIAPRSVDLPRRIEAAVVEDLDGAYYPDAPIVPYVEVVHDRITLEIMRGCPHRCRYCSAGWTRGKARMRSVERLVDLAVKSYERTGFSEISLTSLSSSDYPDLGELVTRLNECFAPKMVSLSLPSLRVDEKVAGLPSLLSVVRRAGLTLAPEAGTSRLRRALGKHISDEDLYRGVEEAFRSGWSHVKLYFMIGLPTERDEDIEALERMVLRVAALGKAAPRRRGRVNVTLAPFVPKAHTPFQWEAMASRERLQRLYGRLRESLRQRAIRLKTHNVERTLLEAAFSRGDRRLGAVVRSAWESGCRLDAWDECFDRVRWEDAFRDCGVDPAFYAHRRRGREEVFPWDHISCGATRDVLWRSREKGLAGTG